MDVLHGFRLQRTALGHLRDHLENARMAEFMFVPVTDEAKGLTAQLLDLTLAQEALTKHRTRRRRQRDLKSFERAVAAFSADLIHHSRFEEAGGFMYRPGDKDLLGQTMVSVRSFEQIVPLWTALGWMEATGAFEYFESFEEGDGSKVVQVARARRFRATELLLNVAAQHGVTAENLKHHFQKDTRGLSPIVVRSDSNGAGTRKRAAKSFKVKGTKLRARLAQEAERVSEINSYLAKSGFDLTDTPVLFRLFNRGDWVNFNFDLGGRLYCRSEDNWQQAKPEARRLITWRGEPTVELDVRASHLGILYAICGDTLPQDEDPYLIPPYDRELTKGLFTVITGRGGRPTRWTKELGEVFLAKHGRRLGAVYKVSSVVDALFQKHPPLRMVEAGKLDWSNLQFEESECFVDCLIRLGREHGISGLPIHDSLIVAQRHREIAEQSLGESYRRRFGYTPTLRVKT